MSGKACPGAERLPSTGLGGQGERLIAVTERGVSPKTAFLAVSHHEGSFHHA